MSTTDEAFNSGYKLALKHVNAMVREVAAMDPKAPLGKVFVQGITLITKRLEKVL